MIDPSSPESPEIAGSIAGGGAPDAARIPPGALTFYASDANDHGELHGFGVEAGTMALALWWASTIGAAGGAAVMVHPDTTTGQLARGLRELADALEAGFYGSPATANVWAHQRAYDSRSGPRRVDARPGVLPPPGLAP